MSLKSFYPEQFDRLNAYAISATEVVRGLRIDPEMKPMLMKALSRMEEGRDFPHAFTLCTAPFTAAAGYFDGLLAQAVQMHDNNAAALARLGVRFTPPFGPDDPLQSPANFVAYA